jgi:DNA gyrase subunit B
MSDKIYNENSTQHISPREFTRKRPGTYCGSTEYSTQLIRELFANALDEHNIGHGNVIKIEVDTSKNLYTVQDFGQGFIPGAPRDNGETMFSECFSVINTSGKYDDADDSIYGGSALGLNGIGMKLVCYLSSWSQATTTNGSGKRETITYKDGLFESREITEERKDVHGTMISYKPDPQFFQHQEANFEDLRKMFTDISALCPSLTIEFTVDGQKEIFHSSRGLNDLIDAKVGDNEILSNRFIARRESGADLFDICLTYTSSYSEDVTGYVNFGLTESGVHMTALRTNLTRLINKFANDKKIFKTGETNLTGQELAEGLIIIFNLKAKKVAYDSQSKVRVVDIDKTLINQTLNEDFVQWLESNQKDVKIIIDKALAARKAREAAKKARDNAREKVKKKEKALKFDSKLADCYSKDRSKCEIYITEGDSASGNLKTARDNEFQAVIPVRGKILNTQKATLDKVQKNAEIMTMIDAFGLTVDTKNMKITYDPKDLRYGKIIIESDADVDGR